MRRLASFVIAAALPFGACSAPARPAPPAVTPVVPPKPVGPTPAQIAAESERINAWFATKYEEDLAFSPMELTSLGRKQQYDQLDDASDEGTDRYRAWLKASVAEMESQFQYALLSDEAKTSYDLWKYQYELSALEEPYRDNGYLIHQMGGLHTHLPTFLINYHSVATDADMVAYIARVNAVPRVLDQVLVRVKQSAAAGIRPPKFAFDGAIEQAQKIITGAPFTKGKDSALWADAKSKIDALLKAKTITAARAKELQTLTRTALISQLKPGYQRLIAWEKADRANAPVNPSGVGTTQANGKAYYEARLEQMTTTKLTAEEIHTLGLSEVARLRGEMEAIKSKVGFTGDLQAFFKFIDDDAQFQFPDTDAGRQGYLDAATAAIANIKQELPNYFGTLPKADLVVKRVEAFREQPGAAQHYHRGTPDGSRPGVYYVHLSDMKAMPKVDLEVVAYHEGLPGHHMQIAIAQELTSVPLFRTQIGFTAYAEGWALYSEWLAKQMPGTFQDPYADFGRLSSEMWRAVRLVVDTGLHAKGWTEQQAIDYFRANTPTPLAAVTSEVRRYLVSPGQATSYKIGMIKIQQLRAKAEAALGAKFDIKGFHDTVLGGGALPLAMLERRVDQWIESR